MDEFSHKSFSVLPAIHILDLHGETSSCELRNSNYNWNCGVKTFAIFIFKGIKHIIPFFCSIQFPFTVMIKICNIDKQNMLSCARIFSEQ